ncbi:MAG: DUF2892 domain-containing protein [Bacteroidales bacterium]|jgi:hypothetical protein|nr:DUF2892 domain-containing protein [Bacteroidales bacterium]
MKKNVGVIDKIIRIVAAVIIALLYYFEVISGTLGIVLIVVAIILLLTALLNFCGIYALFGCSTCSKKKEEN